MSVGFEKSIIRIRNPEELTVRLVGTGNPLGVVIATVAGIFGTILIAEALPAKDVPLICWRKEPADRVLHERQGTSAQKIAQRPQTVHAYSSKKARRKAGLSIRFRGSPHPHL